MKEHASGSMSFMPWLRFAARQLWCDRADIDRLLGRDWGKRLQLQVRQAEAGSAGEVRLCIEAALAGADIMRARRIGVDRVIRERALDLFGQLRVWDTEHNSGVLLYVLVSEQALEIVADRGLRAVTAQAWQDLARQMAERLRQGQGEQALVWGLEQCRQQLAQARLPVDSIGNELDDRPVVR